MPSGRSLAFSAILLQIGLVVLTLGLLADSAGVWIGAVTIVSGLAAFITQVRGMLRHRLARPPALPARDWSTWQTHAALAWLLVAVVIGVVLSIGPPDSYRLPLMWLYGIAGLVGFLAQMVTGMQGRLVPLYAWYRADAASGAPPALAANALPSAPFARSIFLCWAAAVPLLAWGVPRADDFSIRAGSVLMSIGVSLGCAYLVWMLRRAVHSK